MNGLFVRILVTASLGLTAFFTIFSYRSVRANVQVQEATVNPWSTPAETAPMPTTDSSAPYPGGTPPQPYSRPFIHQNAAGSSRLIANSVGTPVDVLWNGRWYPALVRKVIGPGRWLITYIGYSSYWDEVVGSDRIRLRKGPASSPHGAGSGTTPPRAQPCGFGSTCGAVPLNSNPTGLFGTGTW
jgi:hypothetical protein